MKKIIALILVLLITSLACTTLTGGNNTQDNQPVAQEENTPNETNLNNAQNEENVMAEESANEGDSASPSGISGGVSSDISTNSACYNPFYPVNEDTVWTYEAQYTGESPTQFTIETVEATDALIKSKMTFPEFSSTVTWHCGEQGLFSSEFAQFSIAMMPGLDIETVNYDGITLPVEDDWQIGHTWESNYEISMSFSQESITIEMNAKGSFENEITAIEEVEVPAGKFAEAYKVETHGTISTAMTDSFSMEVPFETSTWYVKGIGMIKSLNEDENGTSAIVLISIQE